MGGPSLLWVHNPPFHLFQSSNLAYDYYWLSCNMFIVSISCRCQSQWTAVQHTPLWLGERTHVVTLFDSANVFQVGQGEGTTVDANLYWVKCVCLALQFGPISLYYLHQRVMLLQRIESPNSMLHGIINVSDTITKLAAVYLHLKLGQMMLILTPNCVVSPRIVNMHSLYMVTNLKSVKCYHGGRKIDFIPSISKIQTQMWCHCVQYTRRHLMSLISHC